MEISTYTTKSRLEKKNISFLTPGECSFCVSPLIVFNMGYDLKFLKLHGYKRWNNLSVSTRLDNSVFFKRSCLKYHSQTSNMEYLRKLSKW